MRHVLIVLLLAACGSDGTGQPPLTDATWLPCPAPGGLPIELDSRGWQKSQIAMLATNDPGNKYQAADVLGYPCGKLDSVFLLDTDTTAAGPISYQGIM